MVDGSVAMSDREFVGVAHAVEEPGFVARMAGRQSVSCPRVVVVALDQDHGFGAF